MLTYTNQNNKQYVITFINDMPHLKYQFRSELERPIEVADSVTVINNLSASDSILSYQLSYNNIAHIRVSSSTELDAAVFRASTEYVLIMSGNDGFISANIDDKALALLKDTPVIIGGIPEDFPAATIERGKNLAIDGKSSHLSATCIFGKKSYLIDLFEAITKFRSKQYPIMNQCATDFNDLQLSLRMVIEDFQNYQLLDAYRFNRVIDAKNKFSSTILYRANKIVRQTKDTAKVVDSDTKVITGVKLF